MMRLPKGSTSDRTQFGILEITRDTNGKPTAVHLNGQALMPMAREGERWVWRWKSLFVVKIDSNRFQSLNEALLWKRLKPEDRKFFAATLYLGRGFVLQRFRAFTRIGHARNIDRQAARLIVARLVQEYKIEDMYSGDRQWGVTRQKSPVIHDYGVHIHPEVIAEKEALGLGRWA